jgi:hypothetical protein
MRSSRVEPAPNTSVTTAAGPRAPRRPREATFGIAAVLVGATLAIPGPAVAIDVCKPICGPSAPLTAEVGEQVTLSGAGSTPGTCGQITGYEWFPSIAVPATTEYCATRDCVVTFLGPGVARWHFYTYAVTISEGGTWTAFGACNVYGEITITKDPDELQVGDLLFKADSITHSGDNWTLTGNVRVNDVLAFSAPVTFRGDPASGHGDLFTSGTLSFATAPSPTNVVVGANQAYVVDGALGTFTPELVPPDAALAFTFQGVPLYQTNDPMILLGPKLTVVALAYLGKGGGDPFFLASVVLRLTLQAGDAPVIADARQLRGDGVPGIVAEVQSLAYDPATSTLSGGVDLTFPSLTINGESSALRTGIVVENGCINSLSAHAESLGERSLSVGPAGHSELELTGLAATNLCDAATFGSVFAGMLFFGDRTNDEGFTIRDSTWLYEPAHTLTLLGGTPVFVNRPVTGARARLVGLPSSDVLFFGGGFGTGGPDNGGDVIRGTLTAGAISPGVSSGNWQARGFLDGTFTLSPACRCPSDSGDTCRIGRAALLELYGTTPEIPNVSFAMAAAGSGVTYAARFRGNNVFAGLSRLAVDVVRASAFGQEAVVCVLGANLVARPTVSAGAARAFAAGPVERSVTLAHAEDLAIFAAKGTGGTLPSIYLAAPNGKRITPSTTAQLRGAAYATDPENEIALFSVTSASAGTWTLGVDNLDASEVELTVLAPQPPPVTTFTQVQTTGASVAIAVSVAPASTATTVTLYYSRTHDGLPEGVIAEAQPATTGTVAATWDIAELPTGSYYVFAVTDDALNPPVTTWAPAPVLRDFGGLAAPTGLKLRRDGATATLTWTPSTSAAVVGYTVRYSDDLRQPGYPLSAPAPLPNGATVAGLASAGSYRFCVVGYDLDGNLTPESSSVTAGPGPLRRRLPGSS